MGVADLSFSWPEPARDSHIAVPMPDPVPEFLDETEWAEDDEFADVVELDDARHTEDWDSEVLQLHAQLAEAEQTILRLETDRSVARRRIEELEAAEEWATVVIAQQRRRLVLLERQVEDIRPSPKPEAAADDLAPRPAPSRSGRTSLLDRLLGGASTPVTADA